MELDRLRRRRGDLGEGRGAYAKHPVIRAVLDHEQAQASVARLQARLARGRLPRRDRRETEADLARWRSRLTAAAKRLDDISGPERRRLDQAEARLTGRLTGLYDQRDQRVEWLASHPEAARRLDSINQDVEALNRVMEGSPAGVERGRAPARDRAWVRDVPVASRNLDVGLGR